MAGTQLGPGWYADPADKADLRWWDGTRWTTDTRGKGEDPTVQVLRNAPPSGLTAQRDTAGQSSRHQAAGAVAAQAGSAGGWAPPTPGPSDGLPPSRVGRVAVLVVAGLTLAVLGAAVAFLLHILDADSDQSAAHTGGDISEPVEDDTSATSDAPLAEDALRGDAPLEEDPVAGSHDIDAVGALEGLEEHESDDDPPITIDLDGQCQVTLPLTQAQEEQIRAWDFPECTSAPVALAGAQERWIVVIASLNGDDFAESDAWERAAREGGDAVLWSSHYPSLNPNLWVVFDGPFVDESLARDAANRRGGGAYERVLSDDEGDRYCLVADGCIGERGR